MLLEDVYLLVCISTNRFFIPVTLLSSPDSGWQLGLQMCSQLSCVALQREDTLVTCIRMTVSRTRFYFQLCHPTGCRILGNLFFQSEPVSKVLTIWKWLWTISKPQSILDSLHSHYEIVLPHGQFLELCLLILWTYFFYLPFLLPSTTTTTKTNSWNFGFVLE